MNFKYSFGTQWSNDNSLCNVIFKSYMIFFIGLFISLLLAFAYTDSIVLFLGLMSGVIAVALLFIVSFIRRIRKGMYLAKNGLEIKAKITSLKDVADIRNNMHRYTKVEYAYIIDGQEFKQKGNFRGKPAMLFFDNILILVDPKNHARSIIKDFVVDAQW